MSLQVVRDVSGQSVGPEEARSPVVPRKNELDKVSGVERINKFSLLFQFLRYNFTAEVRKGPAEVAIVLSPSIFLNDSFCLTQRIAIPVLGLQS